MKKLLFLVFLLFSFSVHAYEKPYKGIFITPEHSGKKWLLEFIHYSQYSDLNMVVIHAKTPRGRVYFRSENKTAIETKAVYPYFDVSKPLKFFKKHKIRTVAKLDVFLDSNLAVSKPELSIKSIKTGKPWKNKNGLSWTNPYNKNVWKYNADLALELAEMGFDEIQFDYIRFPSDGALRNISKSNDKEKLPKEEAISQFLSYAKKRLSKTNVEISADIFGLTAWKRSDFGIGQVLEKISPHVDIICPMFYPSHFPKGFLGFDNPSDHPEIIMFKSIEKTIKRTDKIVRPWIQAFSYSPSNIELQIKAVKKNKIKTYCAWNSSTDYENFYKALEIINQQKFPQYFFYKSIEELKNEKPKILRGEKRIVNYTDYKKGYSIISLEKSDKTTKWSYPVSVLSTIDEAVLDKILNARNIKVSKKTSSYYKALKTAVLMAEDINKEPQKIMPGEIFIDWKNNKKFTKTIPPEIKRNFYRLQD